MAKGKLIGFDNTELCYDAHKFSNSTDINSPRFNFANSINTTGIV